MSESQWQGEGHPAPGLIMRGVQPDVEASATHTHTNAYTTHIHTFPFWVAERWRADWSWSCCDAAVHCSKSATIWASWVATIILPSCGALGSPCRCLDMIILHGEIGLHCWLMRYSVGPSLILNVLLVSARLETKLQTTWP